MPYLPYITKMDLINEKDVEYNMEGLAADLFNNLKVCFSKKP